MGTVLVAGLLGLFGTIVGAAVTTWTTRVTAHRAERQARDEARRQEFRSAVIRFAVALLAYRLAEMDRWFSLHGGLKDRTAAAEEAYRTRAVAWNAFYELDFSTDEAEITRLARCGIDSAHNISKANTRDEMDYQAHQTRINLATMIAAARTAQPGALAVGSVQVLEEQA